MKLDDTLKRIMERIVVEVKDKYGIAVTLEDVYNVIESQIEATKIGFAKNISIHWIKLGKFLFTERSNRKKEIITYMNNINDEDTDLTNEQKEQAKKEFIVTKAEEKKKLTADAKSLRVKHSLDDINNSDTVINNKLPILQIISKPKKEEQDE